MEYLSGVSSYEADGLALFQSEFLNNCHEWDQIFSLLVPLYSLAYFKQVF